MFLQIFNTLKNLHLTSRFLREQDLENYIAELIPTLPQLNGLEKSFHSFYTCTAVSNLHYFFGSGTEAFRKLMRL